MSDQQPLEHYVAIKADLERERDSHAKALFELDTFLNLVNWRIAQFANKSSETISNSHSTANIDVSNNETTTSKAKRNSNTNRKSSSGKLSVMDLAVEFLQEKGKPVHASEILKAVHDKGKDNATIKSLTGGMPQDARKRFHNLGRNVWALTKWERENYRQENKRAIDIDALFDINED